MQEITLRYGCNPAQLPARLYTDEAGGLPLRVLNGSPGYINFCDALNGWQLVRELKRFGGIPAAASFKHVSPAGAGLGLPLSDVERVIYSAEGYELSPLAAAYARARGADRMSSFGDWAALSDTCDEQTALFLKPLVSDGVIAPAYTDAALEILKSKRKGGYAVVQIDPGYEPKPAETREIFGITFEQKRNDTLIDATLLTNIVTANKTLPESAVRDLCVALITLKYTQSNSVAYAVNGQVIGVGAGQQSRIHCVRLAGQKADNWRLRQHEKTLALPFKPGIRPADKDNAVDLYVNGYVIPNADDIFTSAPPEFTAEQKREWLDKMSGISLGSDAFFPFSDNIERAKESGVSYIAQPGGSVRDSDVIAAADKYGMVMACNGVRLFHH